MNASRRSWDIPPLYFLLCLAIEVAIAVAPGSQFVYYPYDYIGAILAPAGLVIAALALVEFRRAGTTRHPHESPSALVTTGPYRFSRNPMYFGLFLILLGAAFALQRLLGFLVPFVFSWIVSRRFIEPEEERLQAAFGAEYEAYLSRTRRWL
jgi:protein-S-isoprenylcysteine O-methyltransferase Ste14